MASKRERREHPPEPFLANSQEEAGHVADDGKKTRDEENFLDDVHNLHNVHATPDPTLTTPAPGATLLEAARVPDPAPEPPSAASPELAAALSLVNAALDNPGAEPTELFSEPVIQAIKVIRDARDKSLWLKLKARLQAAKPKGVNMSDIASATRPAGDRDDGNVADALVALAQERAELFHDPAGACFATLTSPPHATYRIDTPGWSEWLSYSHYAKTKADTGMGRAASDQALRTARTVILGLAKNEGPERDAYLRAARSGEAYYLDLGDEDWRAVEITAAGWRIVTRPPVTFWRPSSLRPLPVPVAPGTGQHDLLWRFVNIAPQDRYLALAWMLESWRPETPFPVLELVGMQGSAKSSSQERLRYVLDHNAVPLRAAPKSVEDLFVSAAGNWLTSYNNLSHLSGATQDAICSLATGGGYAGRTLYTNADETVFEAKRPVVINGITPIVTAQDLTDRVIHLECPPLERYIPERSLTAEFEASAPSILGGLLDLFSAALAVLPSVKIARPPRMADFAHLGEALMISQAHPPGAFLKLYQDNRRDSIARGLEASPVAAAIRAMVDAQRPRDPTGRIFEGTMSKLLDDLADHRTIKNDAWPKSPRGLGDMIRRQKPALADIGIHVDILPRTRDGIPVRIVHQYPE